MDLTELFANEPRTEPLDDIAKRTVEARDHYDDVRLDYETLRAKLMESIEAELAPLREATLASEESFNTILEQLRQEMMRLKADSIPLPDRPPIELKIIPGRKGQATKKFLIEQLGKKTAEAIWSRLPQKPDSTVVEVPGRNDTPPSS